MRFLNIFIIFSFLSLNLYSEEVQPVEELFDAGKRPFLVRAFGLNYPDYKPVESRERYKFYILVGPYTPTNLCSSQMCFSDFFGSGTRVFSNFEFEFGLFDFMLGEFGIKTGTGFYIAQAKGIFEGLNTRGKENVTFLVLPLELLMVHTFTLWREQLLVPYIEGGFSYFSFFQFKSSGATLNGGRSNLLVGFGLKILLDWINYKTAWKLDSLHGINDTFLVISYRYFSALNKAKTMDFTGSMILFGFSFDF